MNIVKEARRRARNEESYKQAQTLTKKELEDFYVETLDEKRNQDSGLKIWTLMSILIIMLGGIIVLAYSSEYEGSEESNYATMSQELCYEKGMEPYRYIIIEDGDIEIMCGREKVTLHKE